MNALVHLLLVATVLGEATKHCASLEQSDGFLRVRGLAIVRSKLELTQPLNEYKPAGSQRDAFQIVCSSDTFSFQEPLVSHGASSDSRPFGQHFLHPVPVLPKCDVTVSATTILMNRDWFRNIWHRVANDMWPAYRALKRFGLENEQDLNLVHLDWAKPSFEDLYALLAGNRSTFLKDLPAEQNVVCFDDALFIVSRSWYSTWPEGSSHDASRNDEVFEFGKWMTHRAGLDASQSLFQSSRGKKIKLTWVSRNPALHGNRAIKNEEELIPELQAALGDQVVIEKVTFEEMSLHDQMRTVRETDIFFGMHGAGLTHILWLPEHAVVVEVLPKDFHYLFYERVAKISGLRYIGWANDDDDDMVEWSWRPHTKFTNLILRKEKILPKFEEAIRMLEPNWKGEEKRKQQDEL